MKRKGDNDLAMVYILDILTARTDPDNVKQFREIEEELRDIYGLDMDRRTIAAKINLLVEKHIIKRRGLKGPVYYDNRDFLDEELDLLVYSVMANRNIPAADAIELTERISELGGPHFAPKISYGRKMLIETRGETHREDVERNREFFLTLAEINEAIRDNHQISFDYCRYGIDKKLHVVNTHTASPYYVTMKDQELWMVAYSETHETVSFFRIDRIKNISILNKKAVDITTVPGYELGLDTEYLRSSLPYMYSDKPVWVEFRADEELIDHIVDWFGRSVKLKRDSEDSSKVIARLRTSPMAMEHWAKQYLDRVEIIKPLSLRKTIIESLENGVAKYTAAEK